MESGAVSKHMMKMMRKQVKCITVNFAGSWNDLLMTLNVSYLKMLFVQYKTNVMKKSNMNIANLLTICQVQKGAYLLLVVQLMLWEPNKTSAMSFLLGGGGGSGYSHQV